MTAKNGALVLIQVGDGAPTEGFTTLGGLRLAQLELNTQVMDATTVESGVWRTLLSGAGIRSMKLGGRGMFTEAASEETLRGYAFAGGVNNYRFVFANGDRVTGPFLVVSYERSGDIDEEENYSVVLESAGQITFSAA